MWLMSGPFLSYVAANKIKVGYSSLNCKMSQLLCISWGAWCLLVNVFIFVILTKILSLRMFLLCPLNGNSSIGGFLSTITILISFRSSP